MSPLQTLLASHRAGANVGLYSVCCSNDQVLRAAMQVALAHDTLLLVEATSNQVDQFGGYTGMTPAQYRDYVGALADTEGFPRARLILGGDHLGPNAWQKGPAAEAMAHARVLIAQYVAAGFHKIHLDCSMACADDPVPLPDAVVAARSAELAEIAERTAAAHGLPPPVYVIGTEVPIPGGEASLAGGLQVTTPAAAAQTLAIHAQAFDTPSLRAAWQRVIALVVQPGVDFDHSSVHDYDPAAAAALADFLEQQPRIVFEAHSTDYQREDALHALVRDHFAILKVGPAATFAYREALCALAAIEAELLPAAQCSQLPQVLDAAMQAQPGYWQSYYPGDAAAQRLLRRHSFSDRCRYYWGEPTVRAAVDTLFANLEAHAPPLVLLSQFLPEQYRAVRAGQLATTPAALVQHRIGLCLDEYARACSANRAGARQPRAEAAAGVAANG
ncbi:D-tagatose-1,6-bisphosphate aldolase subunit KbaZ [Xanthomonas sacchari]|uniref:D-tagatose-bisphosphate aldolase, class II, non-catalytic subunit n=1 Tax=Xanthomonas sacchari TaxID=56458 RepID=A0AA46Y7L7_9XANT|nr:D-tagatose-bisphosphate aldolase, class II, non-catalytic subunit [Xanthomonas sacchari]MCW0367302.1 D-tagatose-1,6-bisphosphate aldolase subunit KbaZ [Xanthomonas sacchari]MCW0441439.1 D-tagatose-1,6-bisphosphate aldolase subunit KbaZ [Xanthomonas sacchari]UYK88316.1 D-tagatose-bisphosphate aldolase, class II, non-catalytic subunit [Xanthomonas sacchari]